MQFKPRQLLKHYVPLQNTDTRTRTHSRTVPERHLTFEQESYTRPQKHTRTIHNVSRLSESNTPIGIALILWKSFKFGRKESKKRHRPRGLLFFVAMIFFVFCFLVCSNFPNFFLKSQIRIRPSPVQEDSRWVWAVLQLHQNTLLGRCIWKSVMWSKRLIWLWFFQDKPVWPWHVWKVNMFRGIHVWIFSQPVRFKVPLPTPKITISPRGCVISSHTNTVPIIKKTKESHVLSKMEEFLTLMSWIRKEKYQQTRSVCPNLIFKYVL